jgi:4-hydroxybenzoate polyprenyltransferase
MISIFRLIRLPNLIIIGLTLYFTKYFLIRPLVELAGSELKLSNTDFFLLNLSVIFIAAAGYIINDYFDTKIDFINKPERVIVGKSITRRYAILWHVLLSFAGVSLGFYLGYKSGMPKLGLIQFLSVGLLWFYSTDFKRLFLIGNLVVAFLSGLVPLIAALFEPNRYFIEVRFVLAYCIFAFIISLIREIVKDMEDVKGDSEMYCKTLPVVWGIRASKYTVLFLSFITMALLGIIQYLQFKTNDMLSFWYFTLLIQVPFFVFFYMIIRAGEQKEYKRASLLIKLIMLTGITSMFVFYYSLLK